MSRKFGKFLLFSAVAGAAAYGTYYYLKAKEGTPAPAGEPEGDDDFDDFGEDLDDDAGVTKERSYVSLNLDKAEAIASEAFHKAKEVIADSVQQVKDTVKSVTESQVAHDGNFTDLTALNKEKENASQESPSDKEASDEPAPEETPAGEAASGTVEEFFDDDNN
ncbi:MAG: hypothetical protein HFI98_02990 [Lachnospiraceae bacterium]|nr:hypothetical protein [Lachnospiraceae bacterium]